MTIELHSGLPFREGIDRWCACQAFGDPMGPWHPYGDTAECPEAGPQVGEVDVCEDCATHLPMAPDPDNGHRGGYGSVDPCGHCGDGHAGTRKRARLVITAQTGR